MNIFENELIKNNVLLENSHFVLTSGLHTTRYAHGEALGTRYPSELRDYCKELARKLQTVVATPDVVIGPERGGVAISLFMAEIMGAHSVVAMKKGHHDYKIERRFEDLVKGRRVLLVDDVAVTCETLQKVAKEIWLCKGQIIATAVIWEWLGVAREEKGLGPIVSLGSNALKTWTAGRCKIDGPCSRGVVFNVEHGHGKRFLNPHPY